MDRTKKALFQCIYVDQLIFLDQMNYSRSKEEVLPTYYGSAKIRNGQFLAKWAISDRKGAKWATFGRNGHD